MDDVVAKVIALVLLFGLTILFCCLPYYLVLRGARDSRFRDVLLSYLNCFAGGVFLGTLLIHIMPEGEEEFENYKKSTDWDTEFPYYNLFIFAGLFIVALIEHFAHSFFHHNKDVHHDRSIQQTGNQTPNTGEYLESGFQNPNYSSFNVVEYKHTHNHHQATNGGFSIESECTHNGGVHIHKADELTPIPPHPTHDSAQRQPATENIGQQAHGFQALLLLIALSFHTIFDGLAVGLQNSGGEVWSVFIGIAVHKAVVAFCLGFEMFKTYVSTPWKAFRWMLVFSVMSPLGIAIGIGLEEGNIDENAKSLASSVLQGVAAGTFLYVTFLEVLCSYMGHASNRASKFLYYVFTSLGFGIMTIVKVVNQS